MSLSLVMPGLVPGISFRWAQQSNVMAGYSRPKDGVLSHAYAAAIHVFGRCNCVKTWMPATSAGMTREGTTLASHSGTARQRGLRPRLGMTPRLSF
jgi:hypothetical protein